MYNTQFVYQPRPLQRGRPKQISRIFYYTLTPLIGFARGRIRTCGIRFPTSVGQIQGFVGNSTAPCFRPLGHQRVVDLASFFSDGDAQAHPPTLSNTADWGFSTPRSHWLIRPKPPQLSATAHVYRLCRGFLKSAQANHLLKQRRVHRLDTKPLPPKLTQGNVRFGNLFAFWEGKGSNPLMFVFVF